MDNRSKFIFVLIIMQPVIDIITSLSTTYNISITIGALFKTVLMTFLFIYIIRYLVLGRRKMLLMFSASFMAILLMLIVTVMLKQEFSLFGELNFALKTSYYLTMIFTAIILIEKKMISKELIYQATKIISLIIGVSYWLAIVTKTSINSYQFESIGYSGWFSSANELSVIVLILLTLMVINLRYEQSFFSWLAFILMLSMVPMIGTKTVFLGGGTIVFGCVVYLVFAFRLHILKDKNMLLFLAVVAVFFCLIPLSPIASNTQDIQEGSEKIETQQESVGKHGQSSALMQKILSSRNLYFQAIKEDFNEAPGIRKVFGLGYAGDYRDKNPKLIEMDFFDLFFSYGFVGSVLLVLPLLYLGMKLAMGIFPLTSRKALLAFTLCICLGIAFLAGHVLFAPSVMTYVTILLLALGSEIRWNYGVAYE